MDPFLGFNNYLTYIFCRKKLRAEIQKSFSTLTVSDINDIIPSKDEVTTVKVYSNAGDNLFIYCVNKQPVLFEVDKEKVLYPTGNISSTVLKCDYLEEKIFSTDTFLKRVKCTKGVGVLLCRLKTSYT